MKNLIDTKIAGYYFTQLNSNELEIKKSMNHKENNDIPVAFGFIILLLIILKITVSRIATKFPDLPVLQYLLVIGFFCFLLILPIQKITIINRQAKTFTELTFNFISKLAMGKFFVKREQYHFSSFKACILRSRYNINNYVVCFERNNEIIDLVDDIKKIEECEKICDIVNEFVSKANQTGAE